ncbi:restriction endonuclease subunit S [Pseudomonas sp. BN414]|uniref:restriction endonuclease subunit S n=1 Tax=Pseudomonas sp. BN414 TaxID=2567888 RepID=UPI00245750CF|nr:restriction endonuclease subunit S [Pseudomonas sp. BN414]
MENRWPVVSLSEVAEQCLGKMLDAKKNKGTPLKYLRNPNVKWFEIDLSDLREMPFEDHELDRYGLEQGDVLICEGGEAGRAAIWDAPMANVKFQKAIHRVRCGPRLHNRFLVHRLMADYQSGQLADYYTGVTINHLTGRDLARYRFELPPVEEQQRIAAILDQAESLRAKRRAALEQLDTLAEAIFVEMVGKERSGELIHKPLSDLVEEFRYGTSEKSGDSGLPVLRIPNVTKGDLDVSDLKFVNLDRKEIERLLLRDGDWTCPYQTGHRYPVKLMPQPSV